MIRRVNPSMKHAEWPELRRYKTLQTHRAGFGSGAQCNTPSEVMLLPHFGNR